LCHAQKKQQEKSLSSFYFRFLQPGDAIIGFLESAVGASHFLRSSEPSQKDPNSKLQAQKPACAPIAPHLFLGFALEIWNFSGAWGLVRGISFSSPLATPTTI